MQQAGEMVLKSKRQAIVKDRISALPDALVCHILSFLQTKYAVRTAILSTRWKDMWTCVPNIDFDCGTDCVLARKDAMALICRFKTFVDHVLFFRGSTDIQKFQLGMCNSFEFPRLCDLSRVDGWIRTAIKRNLVELDLTLYFKTSDEVRPREKKTFEFPRSLFMCKTLQVLTVSSNCIAYNPPTSGCFPCLKSLDATLEYPDNNDFKLFPHCPVLESLTIQGTFFNDRVLNFNISAPKLKNLKVSLHLEYSYGDGYNFYIDAPKLENFDVRLDRWPSYYMESVKSLVRANVNVYSISETDANRVAAFLPLISHVKYLSLEMDVEYLDVKDFHLPGFNNLNHLKLVTDSSHCCYYWDFLEALLNRSPNLEDLVLVDYNFCGKQHSDIQRQWNLPELVPICLLLHLKKITMRGFKGWPIEKEVAKYLLKNGKVLKKVTIFTEMTISGGLEELYREFLLFPRGSATCQVKFIKMKF